MTPAPASAAGAVGGDEASAGCGIDPEALRVALVDFLPGLVCLLFGEKAARKVRLEPREVGLPARSGLSGERVVVEDVREDEQAAASVGCQLEAVALAVEGPGEAVRWVDVG